MNSLKNMMTTMLLSMSLCVFVFDLDATSRQSEDLYAQERAQAQQQSNAFWAGAIGALAGATVGYLVGSADPHVKIEYEAVEKFDGYQVELLSPKARGVKHDLDSLAKYGQHFNLYDSCRIGGICEEEVIINLYKLGFRLDQVDDSFYTKLARENKVLSDAGYTIWWNSFKVLERQKTLYLTTSNNIISYFNRHEDFIRACQLVNYYDRLPSNGYDIQTWIQSSYRYTYNYPLLHFANTVEADMQKLTRFISRYSGEYVVVRAHATQRVLQHILSILYSSYAYQQEVQQKRQDEFLAEQQKQRAEYERVESERLAIVRKQTEALQEANQLAAERNRLERERNNRNNR